MVSVLGDVDPVKVMDLGMEHSHFDGGGRRDRRLVASAILAEFAANPFLEGDDDDQNMVVKTRLADDNHNPYIHIHSHSDYDNHRHHRNSL